MTPRWSRVFMLPPPSPLLDYRLLPLPSLCRFIRWECARWARSTRGSGQFCAETWASTWLPWRYSLVGRHLTNLLVSFGHGTGFRQRHLSKDPLSRYWLEHCFISSVKTLVSIFIRRAQHRRTCVVTLLKALSTCCCADLNWLVSAIRMKMLVLAFSGWTWQRWCEDLNPFLKVLLRKKST